MCLPIFFKRQKPQKLSVFKAVYYQKNGTFLVPKKKVSSDSLRHNKIVINPQVVVERFT